MKSIKYLAHYDISSDEGRTYSLAASIKVNYILKVLTKIGFDVSVLSAGLTSNKGYMRGSREMIFDNVELIKLPAFKWGNTIQKIIAYVWSNVGFFLYLITHTRKNEPIIVYHSLGLMNVVRAAKKIKKFQLILEIEEIYNDVINKSDKNRQKEINYFKCADKYIFPTELLNEKVNKEHKPSCIIHGTYQVESDRKISFNDGKIHVIYAGTLDVRKNGAQVTVACAEFLPKNYYVHILGVGSEKEIEDIKKLINEINKKSKATVKYDGTRSGEEYIQYIQKCQIGLATQAMHEKFSNTSFQSKILSYMANGLRVVTVQIPAIEGSAIGQDMYYYKEQRPEVIAKVIMGIDFNDGYDGRKKIKELDRQFKKDLKELLSE